MKFTVARDVLAEASVVDRPRAPRASRASPILAGVRIKAEGDELTLSSFDYEVSANSHIPATVDEAGEVLVSGRLLADISKSLPSKPVSVELDGQKSEPGLRLLPLHARRHAPRRVPAAARAAHGHRRDRLLHAVPGRLPGVHRRVTRRHAAPC